jgi:uncharacterized membrane protein YdbT with pleckstrin-like domain
MENNKKQETDDFFAVMRGEDENKHNNDGDNWLKINLLQGEKAAAIAKWNVSPIIFLAFVIAVIFWFMFFLNMGKSPYYLYGEIAWGFYFPIALVFTLVAIFIAWSMKFHKFVITNKRVIAYYGFIRRIAFELKIDQVESVSIYQGIIGRVFGFGTIKVCGVGASKAIVHFVENPFEFRQHFFDLKYKDNTPLD